MAENLSRGLKPLDEDLFDLLPGLRERHALCTSKLEANNGDARPRVHHLFEHLGLELQNLVGAELGCLRAEGTRIASDEAMLPFEDERVGVEAVALALEVFDALSSSQRILDWTRRLEAFVRFANRERLPMQDRAVMRAAEARDIPVIQIAARVIQLGHGRRQQRVSGSKTTHTNMVGNDLASNKDYCRRMLRTFGLPVPEYERVYRKEDAVTAAARIGFPVVVKPNEDKMGGGVSVGMKTPEEVRGAYERSRALGRSVLVEQFIEGCDYRMLVINGKLAAAARRVPAHVVGDGEHTVAELVRQVNQDPRRGERQQSSWTRFELDEDSDRLLAERHYRRASILRKGEIVYLRRVANTSAGGTAIDVTDQVHPENRELAERAAIAIGLDVAGVDLLVSDITQPLTAQGGVICEINSRPGLRKHLWPAEGRPRDVIAPILDMLFPQGAISRIPIAVVTGLGDTHGVSCMLADLLAADGSTIGLVTRNDVFIRGRRVDSGQANGPALTRRLLLDPTVDLAVVDMPLSDAASDGLGYDWCDACAVVNDRTIETPDLVETLRLIVGSARSHVIMSAEDETAYGLRSHPSARVWGVGAERGTPAELHAMALAQCLGRQPADIERTLASLTQAHGR